MGAWGTGVFQDDVAVDARHLFNQARQSGLSPAAAADQALGRMTADAADPDERAVLYFALASLLLKQGVGQHPILEDALALATAEEGLDRWQEAGPADYAQRRRVYRRLARRLQEALQTGTPRSSA